MRSGFLLNRLKEPRKKKKSQSLLNEVWFPTSSGLKRNRTLKERSQSLLNEVWFPTEKIMKTYLKVDESQSLLNEVWFPTGFVFAMLKTRKVAIPSK